MEKLALLISGALGRHPCSSYATFHLCSDTANVEGGSEEEEEVTKMFFSQDPTSLATQPAPGEGGENCMDGVRRKAMKRKGKCCIFS